MPDPETLSALRLIRSEGVGPITWHRLVRHFQSARVAIEALPGLARRGGRRKPVAVCAVADAERELAAAEAAGARVLVWGQPGYPSPLAVIEDAPPVIYVKGDPAMLARDTVGMVGARNASANAKRFARRLASELGEGGLVVASGLARGIDAEAHHGALETGTVAVVAGGIDIAYPEENRELQDEIAARGCVLSEQPPGVKPQARHFPRRNRLISGLSLGVVVVEAAPRSGSLITSRMALEQGREVFAVPGSPLDPRARGTNDLIRQGATLTESADDVLRVLGQVRTPLAEPESPELPLHDPAAGGADSGVGTDIREKVVEALGPAPVPVDEIVRQTGVPAGEISMALLELELGGRIVRHPGGQVALHAE